MRADIIIDFLCLTEDRKSLMSTSSFSVFEHLLEVAQIHNQLDYFLYYTAYSFTYNFIIGDFKLILDHGIPWGLS